MRCQKPVRDGRSKGSSSFLKRIKAGIRAEARHYDVSESFVINNMCAHCLKIPVLELYQSPDKNKRKKKNK